jgi:hypothetical protein
LDPVLAEDGQPGGDGLPDPLDGDRLRDGDEGDVRRVTPGAGGGGRDPVEDALARGPEIPDAYFRRRNEGISRSSAS